MEKKKCGGGIGFDKVEKIRAPLYSARFAQGNHEEDEERELSGPLSQSYESS